MELRGKVVLVTGGACRLGRAAVLALAGRGARVVVHYGRSAEEAGRTVGDAQRLGGEAWAMQADLADEVAVQGVIPAAQARFGVVDVLVNNAAVFEPGGFAETTPAAWDRHFTINLKAPFLLSQAFAAQLPAGATGKIVNVGDWRALRPGADHFAYTITKAALAALTQAMAVALAPRIQVTHLALGAILPPPGMAEGQEQALTATIPLGRLGAPEDVARALLFLLESDFVTGATVVVDGGRSVV